MQFLLVLVVSAIAAASFQRSESLLVRAVIDGNTIDVVTFGRVRLLGIDAPKIGRGFDRSAPLALEAREKLGSLVLNHWVRLEHEARNVDPRSRVSAYVVREDGLFVNAALVREGLARVRTRPRLTRLAELERAEREARSFRRGLWRYTEKNGIDPGRVRGATKDP